MPDHLHVLLTGAKLDSDLLRFVQRFKQMTGFRFKTLSGDRPWQESFFDRVLRENEKPNSVARYIFDNPSSGGLPSGSPSFLLRGGAYLREAAPDGAKASSLHLDS
jgi:hypothetical protein